MDRRRLLHSINIIIAVGLAGLVVWTTRPWEIWRFDGDFVASAAAALFLDASLVVVWAQRHSFVLRAAGHRIAPRRLLGLVTFSNTANNLTPAATGEVARVWFLNRNHGVPTDRAGAAIVFERLFLLGLMALTALVASVIAIGAPVWPVAVAMTSTAIYVLALPRLVSPLARRFEDREVSGGRIRRVLVGAATGGIRLWSEMNTAVGTALWSLGAFALQAGVFWIAAANSGLTLSPLETWAVLGGATAAGVVSALPFGLGVAELTAAGIGELLDLDVAAVASAFVLYRLFLTFPLALAGSYAYGRLSTDAAEDS